MRSPRSDAFSARNRRRPQYALAASAIRLPAPAKAGKTSVFTALRLRKTTRTIRRMPVSLQELSNLLWAACGVNRKQGPFGMPGRTAASASNSQEIDIYVALEKGAYVYDALEHVLMPVAAGDLRRAAMTPGQRGISGQAPINLIYVADLHRLTHTGGYDEPGLHETEVQKSYYFVDTGLIAGNVYIFAASRGLAAWFHNCDRAELARRFRLGRDQRVLFAQSVGYPAES
jgi:hypothetical protein